MISIACVNMRYTAQIWSALRCIVKLMEPEHTHVIDEANLAALAAWGDFEAAKREWLAGGTPGVDPDVAAAQADLVNLRGELADPAIIAAAEARLHGACLAIAHSLAGARQILLAGVRGIATRLDSETPIRINAVTGRARRAIAALAGRLHGLVHTCLLAARVSTAQAVAVASSNAAASPSAP